MMSYPQPGDVFGAYEIVRRLGRGGMGVVYEAVHRGLRREVALKLLSADLADAAEHRNRFAREAQTLARLDSPHVVRVYDTGEHDGWMYIATALVPDGDLAGLLRQHGAMAVDDAVDLVIQVARGLQVAHEAGVLHRDIKPSNVLLRRDADGVAQAVLCDLGISAVLDGEHTKTSGVIGTLGYMAPERHEGLDATIASDVYALGCLLYATLTGRAPYEGTDVKVAIGHMYEPVPQVGVAGVSGTKLDACVSVLLAKEPDRRPATAAEVIQMLMDIRAGDSGASGDQSRIDEQPSSADVTVLDPFAFDHHPVPAASHDDTVVGTTALPVTPAASATASESVSVGSAPTAPPSKGAGRASLRRRGILAGVSVVALVGIAIAGFVANAAFTPSDADTAVENSDFESNPDVESPQVSWDGAQFTFSLSRDQYSRGFHTEVLRGSGWTPASALVFDEPARHCVAVRAASSDGTHGPATRKCAGP